MMRIVTNRYKAVNKFSFIFMSWNKLIVILIDTLLQILKEKSHKQIVKHRKRG